MVNTANGQPAIDARPDWATGNMRNWSALYVCVKNLTYLILH